MAIKDHQFCDPLRDPGSADLSAYVDFGAMRQVIESRVPSAGARFDGVECFGPVTQQAILMDLGIGSRLQALVDKCRTQEEADKLIVGCTRLVSGDDAPGDGPGRGGGGGVGGGDTCRGEADEVGGEGRGGSDLPPPGMGIRYKALAMVSKGMGAPVGFQR